MKQKIISAFLVLALLVALTCGAAFWAMMRIDHSYSRLLDIHAEVTQRTALTLALTEQQSSMLFNYLVEPNHEKEMLLLQTNRHLAGMIKELEGLLEEERRDPVRSMEESNTTFARLVGKVTEYVNAGKPELGRSEALLWSVPLTETISKNALELKESESELMAASRKDNAEMVDQMQTMFLIVCATAVILATAIGLVLSGLILKPLRAMAVLAGRVADGDLTVDDVPVRRSDELGQLAQALNKMKNNLLAIIRQVEQSADKMASSAEGLSANSEQISRSSEYIAGISQQIAAGSASQADLVEHSAGALEAMAYSVTGIAASALSTREQSEIALAAAANGDHSIQSASGQMNAISAKMNAIAESVSRVGVQADNIIQVNGLIRQIARQTNILAINASIEAARAGAGGKGFAVVAEQVRLLSRETSQAAEEVSLLMERMQQEMNQVGQAMQAGQQEVRSGIAVVHEAKAALEQIHKTSESAALLTGQAADQTEVVAGQAESALQAVHSIRKVAHEAAGNARDVSASIQEQVAGMEEIASSAVLLVGLAEEMKERIRHFRTDTAVR